MILATLAVSLAVCPQGQGDADSPFHPPVRLKGGADYVKVEAPGYAAPSLYDVDGDGALDLVVGQFAGGKMRVYPGKKDGSFGAGDWLKADGAIAEVPGVW